VTPDNRVLPGNLRERIRLAGPTFALPGAAARTIPQRGRQPAEKIVHRQEDR
jgi:hypothetical protein